MPCWSDVVVALLGPLRQVPIQPVCRTHMILFIQVRCLLVATRARYYSLALHPFTLGLSAGLQAPTGLQAWRGFKACPGLLACEGLLSRPGLQAHGPL